MGKGRQQRRRARSGGMAPLSLLGCLRAPTLRTLGHHLALLALLTLNALWAFHIHPQHINAALRTAQTAPAAFAASFNAPSPDGNAGDELPGDDDKACILCQAIQALTALGAANAPTLGGPLAAPDASWLAPTATAATATRTFGPQQARAPPALA